MSKTVGWIVFVLSIITLAVLLILGVIEIGIFVTVGLAFFLVFLVFALGPETISEITVWKASIKRDVQAAREIREEIERTAQDLRKAVKLSAENAILIEEAAWITEAGPKLLERMHDNLEQLYPLAEPDEEARKKWVADLNIFMNPPKPEPPGDEQ